MAVKILTEYSAYDKVKKYKGKEIRYISKRRFKSLGLKKEEVRGFFSTRKAKTEQTIVCNGIPFDLREKRKCRRIVGYVKGEDGGFYAMTAPPLLPFLFLFLLLSFLLLFFLLSNISNQSVKEPWTPVIDSGIYDTLTDGDTDISSQSIQINGFTDWSLPAGKTENLPISLENPKGNPCYFTFSIVLSDGTVLYESKQVPPGNCISSVTINQPLDEGEYTAELVIHTNDTRTGAPMNSAKSKITIHSVNEIR